MDALKEDEAMSFLKRLLEDWSSMTFYFDPS